jgi:hypothetical protein
MEMDEYFHRVFSVQSQQALKLFLIAEHYGFHSAQNSTASV